MSRYTPLPPQNFGGLPEEHSSYETSRAVIFPVPLERTATYERGTRNGPAAILEASRHMEMFDEELETDFSKEIGIATWPPIDTQDGTFEEVGLESGKIIGRSTLRAISRTIDSVNAPPTVDRPIKTDALTLPITSARPSGRPPVFGQDATRSRG